MTLARPSIEEERWIELLARARAWKRSNWLDASRLEELHASAAVEWKASTLLARIAFFLLTLLAIGAFAGILFLAEMPKREWVIAVVCCGIAELLIRTKRFLRTGIEEALLITGLFAFIAGLPGEPRAEGLLLFALAGALASWRLTNPWFGVLAAIFVIVYAAERGDPLSAGLTAAVIAVGALSLTTVRFRRPYLDMSMSAVAIVATVVVWGIARFGDKMELLFALLPIATLGILFAIRFRLRSAFYVAAAAVALLAVEIARAIDWRVDYRLMLGGGLLLLGATLAERWLRTPRRGITSQKLLETEMALLEIAAVPVVAPSTEASTAPPRHEGGGGTFGGAGASGEY